MRIFADDLTKEMYLGWKVEQITDEEINTYMGYTRKNGEYLAAFKRKHGLNLATTRKHVEAVWRAQLDQEIIIDAIQWHIDKMYKPREIAMIYNVTGIFMRDFIKSRTNKGMLQPRYRGHNNGKLFSENEILYAAMNGISYKLLWRRVRKMDMSIMAAIETPNRSLKRRKKDGKQIN